jgi:hypothetical protein
MARSLGFILLSATASCVARSPVAPIYVQVHSPRGYGSVLPEAVEVTKDRELRPHTLLAQLEVGADGSSFHALVERLRARAARLGAHALVEVRAVYDAPADPVPQATSNVTEGNGSLDAVGAGLAILLHPPRWVAVRARAIRLHELEAP